MTLHRRLKQKADKTYTGYDYTYDGAYSPRVKGKDKKKRQRNIRNFLKRETQEEVNDMDL